MINRREAIASMLTGGVGAAVKAVTGKTEPAMTFPVLDALEALKKAPFCPKEKYHQVYREKHLIEWSFKEKASTTFDFKMASDDLSRPPLTELPMVQALHEPLAAEVMAKKMFDTWPIILGFTIQVACVTNHGEYLGQVGDRIVWFDSDCKAHPL